MIMDNLLKIEPQVLSFTCELNKRASCTIRLSNLTRKDVAFKVKTTDPDQYSVQPSIGIIGPWSTCDIKVRMRYQVAILLNMRCKDKFLIQSTVAKTRNITREMFNSRTGIVNEFKIGVLYVTPPRSLYSKVTNWLEGNGSTYGGLFMKGLTIGFLVLMLWYIVMKVLSLIWSLIFVIMMLVIKMIKSEVSDKVEGWIVKCLATVCIHFFYGCIHFLYGNFKRQTNVSLT